VLEMYSKYFDQKVINPYPMDRIHFV